MGTKNESPEPDYQKQFQAAVSVIQNLPKNGSYRPSYEEMLRFYSYYKQATMGPCLVPRPGFWDPIGRYKWDAWNSLGKMSREEAMSAYITEMKLVAQKVIDTVPLGEVAEDMFGYFEPLYQVIPDMPRPPESFLRRVTGWKVQVLNGDDGAVPGPPCHPKQPAPPYSESQPPRDLDLEVFCDSLEQLEPELVWAEQRGAAGGEPDTRNSLEPPGEEEGLGVTLLGPQELDTWLVGTVRALQENMLDVQGRLQSLESKPQPPEQAGRSGGLKYFYPGGRVGRGPFPAYPPLPERNPAEAQAQGSALASQALGSHAALPPPVALRRPVAVPAVSDPEEVTSARGL
ncbi:acyl-CoA binding domain containing 4, transcript variant X3 [Ictidomys tridecemlineatus]|uniref:acyl-CoA-binding domain-containing protein 4 isoform X3 n=1 Tax=Ictidomys tridecemlineatus TaxID=43179 RepID=UPI000B5415B9|nr:acyl-CoA-binding domain-containing protein 4 isoform X3 [Ictidomys tridecemlineatus]KAG3268769.1 acyl-CoA binding domain containing 4, transcript variant X3 [Ictidomys tridecemlineatus]